MTNNKSIFKNLKIISKKNKLLVVAPVLLRHTYPAFLQSIACMPSHKLRLHVNTQFVGFKLRMKRAREAYFGEKLIQLVTASIFSAMILTLMML